MNKTFDIKRFLFRLLSHWYLFIISVLMAYVAFYYKSQFAVTTYNAYTTLIIKNQYYNSPDNLIGGLPVFSSTKNMSDEIAIMKSYDLNSIAISELDFGVSYFEVGRFVDTELYKSTPFVVEIDSSIVNAYWQTHGIKILSDKEFMFDMWNDTEDQKKYAFGEKIDVGGSHFSIELSNGFSDEITKNRFYFTFNHPESLINEYSNNLNVKPYSSSSSILWLWIIGTVPEKAVDYLNKLVEVYIRLELEEKNRITNNTIKFIDERLSNIVDSLQKAETSLQAFRLENNVIDISQEGENLFKELSDIETNRISLDLKVKYYDYILKDVKTSHDLTNLMSPSVMGVEDAFVMQQITKLSEFYNERDMMYLSINPEKFDEKKTGIPELDLLNYNIEKTKTTIIRLIESNIEVAQRSMNEIEKKTLMLNSEILKLPVTERQMLQIQRKFQLNDNIYTYLLQKRTEAGITQASNKADSQVLDKARRSRVSQQSPTSGQDRTKALIIGLIIPVVFVFIKDFLNSKISSISDIEDFTHIPVIGLINHSTKNTDIPVFKYPKAPISEAFRALRTNLQYMLIDKEQKIIAITSTVGGEGKTFFSVNLASVLALSNKRTLLIGLDLRKPRIHKIFNFDNSVGISTYLIHSHTEDEIIFETEIKNLYFAPAGPIPPNPAELLETAQMRHFIEYAQSKFDYVIIDTPPVALVTDALLIAPYAATFIYVIRQNYSRHNVLKLAESLYEDILAGKLSIVLNDIKTANQYEYYNTSHYGYITTHGKGSGYYEEMPEDDKTYFQKIRDKLKRFRKRKRT